MNFLALLTFLGSLKNNNNKDWFEANRKDYEVLRKDFVLFVSQFAAEASKIDRRLELLDPKKCIFRINRDIRFSSNKSPYKTNFGMNLNIGGSKEEFIGYYLHLEPQKSFFAFGSYMPPSPTLAAIRQEIDYCSEEFDSILSNPKIVNLFGKLSGSKLQTTPKGFSKDHPYIDYLRHKDFILERSISDDFLSNPDFFDSLLEMVQAGKPFLDFIYRCSRP